jgi:hypothetical protein
MEERGNKTIICSVFFLDIVEYSKKSVSGQISLKERFNAFLSTAIRDVPINDRIILDTGDGAAISFLGDVEDALKAALSMRSSLLSEEGLMDPPLLVRMGVNLGPVRLVRDINGQPNIVGDGINVAQRVMGFAEPGQILVSRSYYDAASRLSQEYAGMFHYEGSRTDKHVREHEVYAIGYPGDMTASQRGANGKSDTKFGQALDKLRAKAKAGLASMQVSFNELAAYARELFQQASVAQKILYAGLIVLPLLLLVLLAVKLAHKPDTSSKILVKAPAEIAATTQSGVPAIASAPEAATSSGKPAVHSSKQSESAKKDAASKKEAASKKAKQEKSGASHKSKEAVQSEAASGMVTLAILPWGEVYLDGKMAGVSPPLTKLKVPLGVHVIEVKNANFPVHKESVDIKADKNVSIRHKFAN